MFIKIHFNTHFCTISFDQRLINYKYNDKQRLDCATVLFFNLNLVPRAWDEVALIWLYCNFLPVQVTELRL